MTLRTIVYVSTAIGPWPTTDLEDLLVEARGLNLETDVTGVLLFSQGNFMQCFEGPTEGVALTWQRIRDSRRHTSIIELLDTEVASRTFENWRMGFTRASGNALLQPAQSALRGHGAASAAAEGPMALELLKQFWKNAR